MDQQQESHTNIMPRIVLSRAADKTWRLRRLQDKISVIHRVHNGESKAAAARDIGVPESTLRGWCKAEEKIHSQLNGMKMSGTFEQGLTTSSSDSNSPNNNRPDSSSPPATKRAKTENNLTTATTTGSINNISTSVYDNWIIYYYYYFLANDAMRRAVLRQAYGSPIFPLSGYVPPASIFGNNLPLHSSAVANITMPNTKMSTSNVSSGKQHSQSPIALKSSENQFQSTNNQTSSILSTLANNSHARTAVSSRSPNNCKELNAVIYQRQDIVPTVQVCNTEEEPVSDNAATDNNTATSITITRDRKSPNSLPPGFPEAYSRSTKLLAWLETHGLDRFTSERQMTLLREIRDILSNWMNSVEIKP